MVLKCARIPSQSSYIRSVVVNSTMHSPSSPSQCMYICSQKWEPKGMIAILTWEKVGLSESRPWSETRLCYEDEWSQQWVPMVNLDHWYSLLCTIHLKGILLVSILKQHAWVHMYMFHQVHSSFELLHVLAIKSHESIMVPLLIHAFFCSCIPKLG